jgi:hypothetical protein
MTLEMFNGIIWDEMGAATAFAPLLIVSAILPLLLMMKFIKGERVSLF